jgi:hypothetical protein
VNKSKLNEKHRLCGSFKGGASLKIHTPPELLTVFKRGRYRFRVAENGETEANVERGELRYVDEQGNLAKVKKGKQINFVKRRKESRTFIK